MKSSTDIEERLGNIYASEESLKAHVRKMEERFVRSMKEPDQEESPGELESNLEWFLTWRLKLTGPPTVMWCDGVLDLCIEQRREHEFELSARAYIGPESKVDYPPLCDVYGTIELNPKDDQLKRYSLNIEYEGQEFTITEAI